MHDVSADVALFSCLQASLSRLALLHQSQPLLLRRHLAAQHRRPPAWRPPPARLPPPWAPQVMFNSPCIPPDEAAAFAPPAPVYGCLDQT